MDAARDVGDARVALAAQPFGNAQAAPAVVAVNQQKFFPGQCRAVHVFGDATHGHEDGAGDAGGLVFKRLAHVDQRGVARMCVEQVAGLLDGDFQGNGRGGFFGHGASL